MSRGQSRRLDVWLVQHLGAGGGGTQLIRAGTPSCAVEFFRLLFVLFHRNFTSASRSVLASLLARRREVRALHGVANTKVRSDESAPRWTSNSRQLPVCWDSSTKLSVKSQAFFTNTSLYSRQQLFTRESHARDEEQVTRTRSARDESQRKMGGDQMRRGRRRGSISPYDFRSRCAGSELLVVEVGVEVLINDAIGTGMRDRGVAAGLASAGGCPRPMALLGVADELATGIPVNLRDRCR